MLCEEARQLGARNRIAEHDSSVEPELGRDVLELAAVSALVVGERRAVDPNPDIRPGERNSREHDVEPFRGRVAAEREQARSSLSGGEHGNSSRSMP